MVAINANQDDAPRSGLEKAQATADEMKSSEARWRLVLDTIPVLVTSARPDGSLVNVLCSAAVAVSCIILHHRLLPCARRAGLLRVGADW